MSDGSQPADLPLPENAIQAAEQFSSKYGQLMALTGRLSADQMAALRELDGTLAMAEHVLAGTPVGAGAHSTICGFILNAYAAGRAQGAAAERERIQPELDRIEHDAIARYEEFAATQRLAIAAAEREAIQAHLRGVVADRARQGNDYVLGALLDAIRELVPAMPTTDDLLAGDAP